MMHHNNCNDTQLPTLQCRYVPSETSEIGTSSWSTVDGGSLPSAIFSISISCVDDAALSLPGGSKSANMRRVKYTMTLGNLIAQEKYECYKGTDMI